MAARRRFRTRKPKFAQLLRQDKIDHFVVLFMEKITRPITTCPALTGVLGTSSHRTAWPAKVGQASGWR